MAQELNTLQLLQFAVKHGASDLHIGTGEVPAVRLHGDILRLTNLGPLTKDMAHGLIHEVMLDGVKKVYEANRDVDFSIDYKGVARFRVNAFVQEKGPAAVFRVIPSEIKSLEELRCPPVFAELASKPRGLVLVTGPTGSGKSTTLAAMIDAINKSSPVHILTIEDPIEFVHKPAKAIINQREVHRDTMSFEAALRGALREDPDVMLVGEMRDQETIKLALTAAETGHLVFGTLHTTSAAKTVDRIVDVMPAGDKDMVRSMLSESLAAVVSQTLCKTIDGKGRVAAHEIMLGTAAIRNMIRENKIAQMYSAIQTGSRDGMQTLDQSLMTLVRANKITAATAMAAAKDPSMFKTLT